jgi:RNA polymerase sigma-B factor
MANSTNVQVALERYARSPSIEHRNAVVHGLRHLCARAARRFHRPPGDRADLEHVAVIGLIKACERYRGWGPGAFERYAWRTIVGEVMHYVRDVEGIVRVPRGLRALERRYLRAFDALAAGEFHEPRADELVRVLGIPRGALDDVRRLRAGPVISLLVELRAQTSGIEERVAALVAVDGLPERERTVVLGVYGLGMTQEEVARRLRISQRHVSRLHARALERMASTLA